jgi:isopenicillin N synthase-like dioxygenase
MEEKMQVVVTNNPSAHRGYFPFLEENADEKGEGDLKEGFDFGK